MGNRTSNHLNNQYAAMSQQNQQFEELKIRSQRLKGCEEEIDKRIKELEYKLKRDQSLQVEFSQNQKEFIEKIIKSGFVFPDCFHWTLDITFFIEPNENRKYTYCGIFQYGNYRVNMRIPLKKIKINEIELYKIKEKMSASFYKRDCKDEIYHVFFPFTILCDHAELLDLGLYYDPVSHKDIVYFYNTDNIVQDITPNFSKYVNLIEKYIKWAVEYKDEIINITSPRTEDLNKNTTKDEIQKSFNSKGTPPIDLTGSIKGMTVEQNNKKNNPIGSNSLIGLFK